MIIGIFLLNTLSLYSARLEITKPEIEFNITAYSTEHSSINVEMNFYKHPDPSNIIFNINPKTMERFVIEDSAKKRIKANINNNLLKFSSTQDSFTIRYKINISSIPSNFETYNYLPNLSLQETILFVGYETFMQPVFPEKISLSPNIFVKFIFPKNWKLITSWNTNRSDFKIANVESLLKGIILAGNLEIERIMVKSKPHFILFHGKFNIEEKKDLSATYKKIALEQLKYWNFIPSNFVLVNFVKTPKFNAARGLNYANTLIYFLPENSNLFDINILKLISHEHFHIWNGYYLYPFPGKEDDLNWFKEGLTEYYSLLSLVNAEIIEPEAFLEHMLDLYIKYNSQSNKEIFIHYFFLFFALDMEIRKGTNNTKSLNNFLKNISLRNEFWEKGYIFADIRSELLKVYYWDITDFFDLYLLKKEKINIEAYFSFLGLNTKNKNLHEYNNFFELSTDNKNNKYIANIDNKSDAYSKGLRKNSIVKSYVKAQNFNELSKIIIIKNKKEEEIFFNPWIEENKLIIYQEKETKYYKKWIKGHA